MKFLSGIYIGRKSVGLYFLTFFFTQLSMAQSGETIYKNYCAGCHGTKMQGSSALPLKKKVWKHGGELLSIQKTITNGVQGTEMASFAKTLSAKEIQTVASFIVKSQNKSSRETPEVKSILRNTKLYSLKIEKLVTKGIRTPWGIEFVDSSRALISGYYGELRWMVNGKLDPVPITGLPKTIGVKLKGGFMDIALDPKYTENGWVYLSFAHNPTGSKSKKTPGMTKIVRGKIKDHKWMEEQTLFEVADSLKLPNGGVLWGSRFLFDKDGFLYFTIGDMNMPEYSQLLTKPNGKIYRINPDGTIPQDNPFYGQAGNILQIYSYGNRNVQGIAQHPETGLIYATEHGPKGGDELNMIKKGANFGWPAITYGIDYTGRIISKDTAREGMEQPITYWDPSIATCAIEFVTTPLFPEWKNNLLLTALGYQELRRLVIDGNKVVEQEILLKGQGRVRDVKVAPDGAVYLLTNYPDAILRITPSPREEKTD